MPDPSPVARASERPPGGPARVDLRSPGLTERLQRAPALVVGLLAWSLTVLPLLTDRGVPAGARVSGVVALLSLFGALLTPRGTWTLLLGVDAFLLGSGMAWLLSAAADALPAPTTLGLLAWVLFPLAWGALSSPTSGPPVVDPGPPLEPRRRLGPALVLGSVGAGLVALLVLLGTGRTGRAEADVLLGVVTLGFAVLAVHSGASFLEAGANQVERISWARLLLRLRGPALLLAAAGLLLLALELLGSGGP